jgi:hypothetical protein
MMAIAPFLEHITSQNSGREPKTLSPYFQEHNSKPVFQYRYQFNFPPEYFFLALFAPGIRHPTIHRDAPQSTAAEDRVLLCQL